MSVGFFLTNGWADLDRTILQFGYQTIAPNYTPVVLSTKSAAVGDHQTYKIKAVAKRK